MTIKRTKLPREELERFCLDVLRAHPALATTTSVLICRTHSLYGPTWDIAALEPRASMEAFAEAVEAIEKLQVLFDLQE